MEIRVPYFGISVLQFGVLFLFGGNGRMVCEKKKEWIAEFYLLAMILAGILTSKLR